MNWPNDCCLLYFPCYHMKQAGLDHANVHECLGSKDAWTQTEPLQTSAENDTSDNNYTIGSLLDSKNKELSTDTAENDQTIGSLLENKNIELSDIDIKQEPDTSFEIEKVMTKHSMMEDGIHLPNWQVLGIPGDTNRIIFTKHQLVLHEIFNNVQVTEGLLGSRNTTAVEDDGARDNVSKTDSRQERVKESTVALTTRDNNSISKEEREKESTIASIIRDKNYISKEEKVKESTVPSTLKDSINEIDSISRKEQEKLSTEASTNRDNRKNDSREEKGKESSIASTVRDNVNKKELISRKEREKLSSEASTDRNNISKKDSIAREEKGKELTVPSTIRENVNKIDCIWKNDKEKLSTEASKNRDNINKKGSREEKVDNSAVAPKNKPNKKVDSGNKLAGKKKNPIVTATPQTNAETPSNAESWLRSGGKKPEQVSKASLASMWKQEQKQEMEEENKKKGKKGGGRPKKRKYVRHKPISELKSSKKRKHYSLRALDLDDSEDNKEMMDVVDLKNGDGKEDDTTLKKTKINYVGDMYIDTSDLPRYYTFVKELNKNGEDGYRCNVCNMTFIGPVEDRKRIERHIFTHSEEKRTHKCDTCEKTFPHKSYLKMHMLTHSDVKAFKCPVCGHAGKRRDDVRNHIRRRHSIGPGQYADKDGKPVTLEELGYGHRHIQVQPNEQGLYTCPYCDVPFNSKKELTKHVGKIHRAESGQGMQALVSITCFTIKQENLKQIYFSYLKSAYLLAPTYFSLLPYAF